MKGRGPSVRVIAGRASWRSRALNTLLRVLSRRPLRQDADLASLRRRYEAIDARHVAVHLTVKREAIECNGVAAEWVSVPETRAGRIVLYLHGGSFAFRFPNTHAAFAARLCRRLGARALIPDYRLAPEHPYPAAIGTPAKYRISRGPATLVMTTPALRPEMSLATSSSTLGPRPKMSNSRRIATGSGERLSASMRCFVFASRCAEVALATARSSTTRPNSLPS